MRRRAWPSWAAASSSLDGARTRASCRCRSPACSPTPPPRRSWSASSGAAPPWPTGRGLGAPFMALSFLALSVIPSLKLTDHGLVDVERGEIVPLEVA